MAFVRLPPEAGDKMQDDISVWLLAARERSCVCVLKANLEPFEMVQSTGISTHFSFIELKLTDEN